MFVTKPCLNIPSIGLLILTGACMNHRRGRFLTFQFRVESFIPGYTFMYPEVKFHTWLKYGNKAFLYTDMKLFTQNETSNPDKLESGC
jgi:hypothetical protein